MKYKVTEKSVRHLEALNGLREEIRSNLRLASLAAQDEWANLDSRLPSRDEINAGLIDLSEDHLDEIQSKAQRLRDILQDAARQTGETDAPSQSQVTDKSRSGDPFEATYKDVQ